MFENGVLFLITLLAYFVKGITGFGNTLIINSLFNFIKENRFSTPVDLLLSIPTNSYMAWRERKYINLRVIIPLSFVVILGDIPGILMLHVAGEHILKSILGLVLIGIAIEMLTRKPEKSAGKKSSSNAIWIIGIFSGVLMGLFGVGALLAAYINRTSANRSDYRANLCFVFVIDNIFRLIGYSYFGLINVKMLLFAVFLFPAAILGMVIGIKIDKKINDDILRSFVIILLIVSGAFFVAINRFGL